MKCNPCQRVSGHVGTKAGRSSMRSGLFFGFTRSQSGHKEGGGNTHRGQDVSENAVENGDGGQQCSFATRHRVSSFHL